MSITFRSPQCLDRLVSMKMKGIIDLFSAITMGILYTLYRQNRLEQLPQYGREGYLAYCAKYFDKNISNPVPMVSSLLANAVYAVLIYALFLGISSVYTSIFVACTGKNISEQKYPRSSRFDHMENSR